MLRPKPLRLWVIIPSDGYSPLGTWEKMSPVRSPSSSLESQQSAPSSVLKPYRWMLLGHAQVQIQNVCHLLHIFNCSFNCNIYKVKKMYKASDIYCRLDHMRDETLDRGQMKPLQRHHWSAATVKVLSLMPSRTAGEMKPFSTV